MRRESPRIGIVGGGLTGLALARRLARDGCAVTVLERDEQVGGLATWHEYGRFHWDRFYHVILPSDRHLIAFVEDLGLALEWRRSYTGFYVNGRMYSVSSNLEFLRFSPLSLFSKCRLAWTMLYASRIDDWRALESISAEDWLVRVSGRSTYEKLWKPLLLAKLGESYRRVSAVFIWSYIKRLFSARHSAASKESLGYVRGGYRTILSAVARDLEANRGGVVTGVSVRGIRPAADCGIVVATSTGEKRFDRVVCTSPVPVLRKIVEPSLLDIREGRGDVEYLGVVCVVMVSSKPLVPFYVVNIADARLPFTGIIGMTSVVSTDNTAGRHLTYLPKYVLTGDALFARSDDEIREEFLRGIRRMFPAFDFGTVESVHVNRAPVVQPLQVLGYSSLVPSVETRHPDFFVLNTAQFVNATLNNNEVIGAVNAFYDRQGQNLNRPPEYLDEAG